MDLSIYKNRKVLVTGHTGFKGSWLSIWLNELGAKVSGYSLDPKTEKDNFVLSNLKTKINDHRGNILDTANLSKVFEIEKPEIVFHLAAQPLVLESYKSPIETIATNTLGTANVLEAFRQCETAKQMIVITTDKVYDNVEWVWGYRETDRLGGKDIYSASKAAAEIITNAYCHSFFYDSDKSVVTARAGNVIGGGDWAENRIIPDCIRAIEKNETIILRNPNSIRPWQHVLDPLGGYLMLGKKLISGDNSFFESWNFGPISSDGISVETLVKGIIKSFGNGKYQVQPSEGAPYESKTLNLDISKAINQLKWRPLLNTDEAIKLTAEWYKNYSNTEVYKMCADQIKRYEGLSK